MIFALVLVLASGTSMVIGYNWGSRTAMNIAEETLLNMEQDDLG